LFLSEKKYLKIAHMFKRLLNEFLLGINEGAVSLKYSHTEETKNNWGDKLNPYLFEKITGKKVVHCSNLLNIGFHTNISFIGSVLDRNTYKNLVVCGSGFKSSNSSMKHLPKQVFWTRGPKTREQLLKLGYKNNIPSIYGDPALLMPLFFSSQIDVNRKRSKLGIIPHYVDINNNFITKICSQPDIN
jgi:pyruvyltransferase